MVYGGTQVAYLVVAVVVDTDGEIAHSEFACDTAYLPYRLYDRAGKEQTGRDDDEQDHEADYRDDDDICLDSVVDVGEGGDHTDGGILAVDRGYRDGYREDLLAASELSDV